MNKTQHPPTPWSASNNEIRSLNSVLLATMQKHLLINGINQEANAEFIVKACNSHEALVEALEDILAHAQHSIANNPQLKTAMPDIEAKARLTLYKVKQAGE